MSKSIYTYPEYYSFGQVNNQNGYVMDSLLTYITVELDKFDLNADHISNDLEKLIFTMKNLQTYADLPMTEFSEFWTEEWLKIAVEELDTRRFSAEQYERYAITLARNASAVQMEQVKTAKARAEERAKVQTEERAKADAEKKQLILKAELEKRRNDFGNVRRRYKCTQNCKIYTKNGSRSTANHRKPLQNIKNKKTNAV